jgi:predicted AAA+ superfamily ATPase
MQSTPDADVVRLLYQQNPWWLSGTVPEALSFDFKRRDFYPLRDALEDREISCIIGARRVGKSTLMYQLIQHLLEKVSPSRVMFLKADDYYLKLDEETLKRVFDLYSVNILREPLEKLPDKIYVFIDEVQSLPDWGLFLKRWFDFGYPIKFIVSGSSSATIRQGSIEVLAGRIHTHVVCPMKFLEVVRFKEKEHDPNRLYDGVNWSLRDGLKNSLDYNDPGPLYSAFEQASIQVAGYRDQLLIYLQGYLVRGGYPEVVVSDDNYKAIETLRDYLDQAIYRDIVKAFLIRDPSSFEALFGVLAGDCCQRLNYSTIQAELGVRKETLRDYLFYLEYSFLVTEARFYSKSRRHQERKEKKIYINDIGLRNAVTGYLNDSIFGNPTQMGFIIENVVADHIRRLKFNYEHGLDADLYYWFDERRREVDIILELFQTPIPIEVKYQNDISRGELDGVHSFLDEFNSPFAIIVTKDTFKIEGKLLFVPLWLFLLMC